MKKIVLCLFINVLFFSQDVLASGLEDVIETVQPSVVSIAVDIDNNKLSDLMVEGAKVSTSTPTIGEIEDYFENLFKETNADLVIHFTTSNFLIFVGF